MQSKIHTTILIIVMIASMQSAYGMHDIPQELFDKACVTIRNTETAIEWLTSCLAAARVCEQWRTRIKPHVIEIKRYSKYYKTELLYKALAPKDNELLLLFLLRAGADSHQSIELSSAAVCLDHMCCKMSVKSDTVWSRAIRMGNVTTVDCLLKHGARVNEPIEKNGSEKTALSIARRRHNQPLTQLLLKYGAQSEPEDIADKEAASYMCIGGQCTVSTEPACHDRYCKSDSTDEPNQEETWEYLKVLDNGQIIFTQDPNEAS